MSNYEPNASETEGFLESLERRHEQVLVEIDALAARIEETLAAFKTSIVGPENLPRSEPVARKSSA